MSARHIVVAVALASAGAAHAQDCIAVPADTPSLGSPSSTPFGNNNATDPIFSDTRYQLLIPAELIGDQALEVCDLRVAPAGSRLRQFESLTVTLGHNTTGQLQAPMSANFAGATQSVGTTQWLLPTTANTWTSLGLPIDFVFDPALGDLLIEFRVTGGGAPTGSGTAGFRTDSALPYMWNTGGGETGNSFPRGGLKVQLCTRDDSLVVVGGGCAGSNGLTPHLDLSGSSLGGGTGVQVQLSDAVPTQGAVAFLSIGFDLATVPLDLSVLGAPGCLLHVLPDAAIGVSVAAGTASVTIDVPASVANCFPLYLQWLVLDPGANGLGLVNSNPGRALIGS